MIKRQSRSQKLVALAKGFPRDGGRFLRSRFRLQNRPQLAYCVPAANWATDWVGRYVVESAQTAGLDSFAKVAAVISSIANRFRRSATTC